MSYLSTCKYWQLHCRPLIPVLNAWADPRMIHDRTSRLPPGFLGMDAWMTSRLNVSLICNLRGSFMCLAFLNTLSLVVCPTRHWQTTGLLMQQLDVCILVDIPCSNK